jgi:catechol 2,3-dioxygenase-like lactoylglutathione lyase family enzyme
MPFTLDGLDHLVLTVRDMEASCAFYEKVLGMKRETFGEGRTALKFGSQKLNLHPHPTPHQPLVADVAAPGTADLCFLTATPLGEVEAHLADCAVPVELGPLRRSGAQGPILSLYVRDPDRNLIEIATPLY